MALPPLQRTGNQRSTSPPQNTQRQAAYAQRPQQRPTPQQIAAMQYAQAVRQRTEEIINKKVEKDSSEHNTSFMTNRFLYWSGLLFLTVMNFVITLILLPIMLLMAGASIYVIVLVFGLLFGLIFDFLIKDLEHLERRHHLFAAAIIPVVAIIDLFLIQIVGKNLGSVLQLRIVHNPLFAGSIYLLGFLGPFTYSYLIKKEID